MVTTPSPTVTNGTFTTYASSNGVQTAGTTATLVNGSVTSVTGTSGSDKIDVGTINQEADKHGPTSGVTVNAGAGNDTVVGSKFNDTIYGGTGNDSINGGAGKDYIDGGSGANVLQGGSGSDTFAIKMKDLVAGGVVNDSINDFSNANGTAAKAGWNATDSDFIAFSGFSKGSTLVLHGDGMAVGTSGKMLYHYAIHDAASGSDYYIDVQSTNGKVLGLGDFQFY